MQKVKRQVNSQEEVDAEGYEGYGGYKGKKHPYYPPMGYMPPYMYEYPPMYGMDPYMMSYPGWKSYKKKPFKNKSLIVKKSDKNKKEDKGESKPESSTT